MMRWGFLGASRIGRRALAPAILDCGHRLDAVGARDLSRARDFADAFGAPRAYAGYDALIADPDLDAIYIALTNDAHLPWTIRALEAGKHVLCEKPLALDESQVLIMQEAEARTGRRVMEAFCHIHHPQLARVQSLIASGAIGELLAMQAVFGIPLADPTDFRWQGSLGGGSLLDLGTYCLSLMRVLAGEPRSVSALQTLQNDVDTTFTAQLAFGSITGQFTCSFASAATQHLELIGTRNTLLLDWPISTRNRETGLYLGVEAERFLGLDPYARMVTHFAAMVRNDVAPIYDLSWSRAQARGLDALRLSAAEGRTVSIAP